MEKVAPHLTSFVLVPGYWLGGWAWDAVAAELRRRGHRVDAVTLPGLDPDDPHRAEKTLTDQADALRSAVQAAGSEGSPVVLVVHSGAGAPASLLVDRDPTAVDRLVYVDSGPSSDGGAFDATAPVELRELPLPPFDQLEARLDGLSAQDLETFRQRAVPQPGNVVREPVRLHNDARRDVPTTIITCSFPSETMMRMAREGNPMLAEIATLRDLDVIDLPTGHWPMWSRPGDLAAAIVDAAER